MSACWLVACTLASPWSAAEPTLARALPVDLRGLTTGDIPALYRAVRPAVVKIRVKRLVVLGGEEIEAQQITAQGSGVLIAADATVLTAAHLVQTADDIRVEFADGSDAPARVQASEPAADVATLRLAQAPDSARFVQLADAPQAQIGDTLVLVGFPYDLPATISVGHLNGRVAFATDYAPLEGLDGLVTDARIVTGASGAALFDLRGRVAGIATAAASSQGAERGPPGIGVAISADAVRRLVVARRSLWTGIGGRWISGRLAHALHLVQGSGLLVQTLAAHSPASGLRIQAGTAPSRIAGRELVLGGDVVLSIQGHSLAEPGGYERASRAMAEIGERGTLHLSVQRGARVIDLQGEFER